MKKVRLEINAENKKAERDLKRVDGSIRKTVKALALGTAGLYAMKKGFDFLKESTKQAMEQETTFNTLKNTVELTGKSWGEAKLELDGLFSVLQETTKFGDTDSAKMLQQLTILTGDYEASVKGLPLALDMASSGLFNAETAGRYLGMALAGNIQMLGRYIPELKASVSPQLKTMNAVQKTAFAVDLLTKKFGGMAAKELDTTAGQWKQFHNYWGDLQEAIGDAFLPMINDFLPDALWGIEQILAKMNDENLLLETQSEVIKRLKDMSKEQKAEELARISEKLAAEERYYKEQEELQEQAMLGQNLLTRIVDKAYFDKQKSIETTAKLEKKFSAERIEELKNMVKWTKSYIENSVEMASTELFEPYIVKLREVEEIFIEMGEAGGRLPMPGLDDKILEANEKIIAQVKAEIKVQEDLKKTKQDAVIQDLKNATLSGQSAMEAMKNVVKAEAMEATAGYFASILKTVPFPINLILAAGAGGVVSGLLSKVMGNIPNFATGADFTVPPGYENDSYMMRVQSRERVTVTPEGQVGQTEDLLQILIKTLENKPVANTVVFDDIGMSRYVEQGNNRRVVI